MVSSVRSRPSHYETLGLTPAASDEEISQAFARKMSLFGAHPMGSGAQICIAYETLRDPARRREYDRSLGLAPDPVGRQWAFATPRLQWAPFIASAVPGGLVETALPPEPHVTTPAESIVQERKPMVERPAGAIQAQIEELRARPARAPLHEPEERGVDWKRPVLAVGGFVLAAGLIGALAGMSVKDDAASAVAGTVPTFGRPAARLHADAAAPAAVATEVESAAPIITPTARPKRSTPRHGPSSAWVKEVSRSLADSNSASGQPIEAAVDENAADSVAAQPVAADMPLPNKVIAKTLERVGYKCGDVSGTTAVSSGVYDVTCSSGQSYRASRVRGHYRFHRVGSH
jgi:hypothetical protein